MPILNGIEFIKKVRKDNLNIPIVVTSAYSNKEYLLSCLNLIIQGYLLKPLSSLMINNVLDKIIKLLKLNESFYIQKDFIYDKTNSIFINSKSNEKIKLDLKEKKIMSLFVENKNRLLTYNYIESYVWDSFDNNFKNSSLRTLVKKLRFKLPSYKNIKNIPRQGYMFVSI